MHTHTNTHITTTDARQLHNIIITALDYYSLSKYTDSKLPILLRQILRGINYKLPWYVDLQ